MRLGYARRKSVEFQNTIFKNRAIDFLNRDMKIFIQDLTAEAQREDAEDAEIIALSLCVPLRNLCASAVKILHIVPISNGANYSLWCGARRVR
jgi:hypothetical protein